MRAAGARDDPQNKKRFVLKIGCAAFTRIVREKQNRQHFGRV